jgi:hypothetical protein
MSMNNHLKIMVGFIIYKFENELSAIDVTLESIKGE